MSVFGVFDVFDAMRLRVLASVIRQTLGLLTWGATGKLIPGDWENGHTYDRLIKDHEGILRTHTSSMVPLGGSRVVTNLIPSSDISGVQWSSDNGATAISNGDGSYTIGLPGSGANRRCTPIIGSVDGVNAIATLAVKGEGSNIGKEIRLQLSRQYGGSWAAAYKQVELTAEYQTITSGLFIGVTDNNNCRFSILYSSENPATEVICKEPQCEGVTGQTNQNPSEYQEPGTPGIYNTANATTYNASTGVVTAAVGAALDPVPYIVSEPASTNEFLNSDAPVTQAISVGAGDWTLSVHGSGTATSSANTATGTGFGAATDGSDNTFNITGAGTVDITISGGTPDYVQLENLAFSTSPIITTGASAQRDKTQDIHPYSSAVFNQAEGYLLLDWTPEWDYTEYTFHASLVTLEYATSLLYAHSSDPGRLATYDGVNGAAVTGVNWIAGKRYVVFVRWSESLNELQIGVINITDGGSLVWGTAGNYDGSFNVDAYIKVVNNDFKNKVHALRIFNKCLPTAEIAARHI